MTKLYDKISHNDRRTIVMKFKAGEQLSGPDNSTFVLKADVAMKVTEQYNGAFKKWYAVIYHVDSMVETPGAIEDPEASETVCRNGHVIMDGTWCYTCDGRSEPPRAEVVRPWTKRWFGWLLS